MDKLDTWFAAESSRRRFLGQAALGGAALAAGPALAQSLVDLHLPGGNAGRPMTSAFPGKGSMILQRMHPPLLETPMEVFDRDVFTPNDQFFRALALGRHPDLDRCRYFPAHRPRPRQ